VLEAAGAQARVLDVLNSRGFVDQDPWIGGQRVGHHDPFWPVGTPQSRR
jgi:hypothetical protein